MIKAIKNLNFIRISYFIIIFIIIFYSKFSISYEIYDSYFHHIEINTNNALKTKNEEINKIKKKSLIIIIEKILDDNNKKIFKRKFNYTTDFDKIFKNMIIENEIITKDKYIADIKINFQKKDLISLLRFFKLDYSDNISDEYLIISSYTSNFSNFGLSKKNISYILMENNNINKKNYLIKFKLPKLNANDRFIAPYKNIINANLDSLYDIAKKYNNSNIIITNINENNTKITTTNYFFNFSTKKILLINRIDIKNNKFMINEIFYSLNEWWKKNNQVNNIILNKLLCTIQSNRFSDLNYIRSKIKELSQFNSIVTKSIEFNNNNELIEFFGDFNLLKQNLLRSKIAIKKEGDKCVILKIN